MRLSVSTALMPGKATAGAAAVLPIPTGAWSFLCVQIMVWLPVPGRFIVRTDVNACDCTLGLYGHCQRVCTETPGS